MPDLDGKKLDVDFEVIEHPEDDLFPRLPNVVSRRRHRVKIIAVVREVPDGTTKVGMQADVLVYGQEGMGQKGHVSCPMKIWGSGRLPLEPLEGLPQSFELVVSRSLKDDHLGQGPYNAMVSVFTEAGPINAGPGGDPTVTDKPTDGSGRISVTSEQTYSIEFVSK